MYLAFSVYPYFAKSEGYYCPAIKSNFMPVNELISQILFVNERNTVTTKNQKQPQNTK